MPSILLCILAGGRSSRFAGSKLNLTIDGEPIIGWQVDRLTSGLQALGHSIEGVRINLAPGAPLPAGVDDQTPIVRDVVEFEGPLAGMLAVLTQAPPESIVVFMPPDMPLITPKALVRLIEALRTPAAAIAMSIQADGTIEPLPNASLTGGALALVQSAWNQGIRGPAKLATWSGVVTVPIPESERDEWDGINTRADMERAGKRLNLKESGT